MQQPPEAALPELAAAITRAFTTRLKFEPARLGSKPVEATDELARNGVPVKLSFEPNKQDASATGTAGDGDGGRGRN